MPGGHGGGHHHHADELASVQESRRKWYNPPWLQEILSHPLLGYSRHDDEAIPNRYFKVLNSNHQSHEESHRFPGNTVSTAKYTLITFIPR